MTAVCRETPLAGVGLRVDADGADDDLLALPPGHLAERVRDHKLVVLRGFRDLSRDRFLAFARALEPGGAGLLEWASGPIMDVAVDDDAVNYLFSRERVPLHWDGFFAREPSYLVWQCATAPRRGGATIFADAGKAWQLAGAAQQEQWSRIELTYATEKKAHYGGVATRPLVAPHPRTGHMTLRFAEPAATRLNPLSVTCSALPGGELAALVADLQSRLHHPDVCHHHTWQDGDVVIADNHALLHGRTAIAGGGRRHLRRIQIL